MTTIDIVGGGLNGLTIAHNLLEHGIQVRIWEQGQQLGGLIGRTRLSELDNLEVDRYDHAISSNDKSILNLIDGLGLRSSLKMRSVRQGFYYAGQTYPMSNPIEFLTFPPLSQVDRVRLAYTIVMARQVRDWRELESTPVLEWLTQMNGSDAVAKIWRPLLQARFDGNLERMPATYAWAQLMRNRNIHDLNAREQLGYLTGGYIDLVYALADSIRRRGGKIYMQSQVDQVLVDDGQAHGLYVNGRSLPSDGVVLTVQTPIARMLLPPQAHALAERWSRLNEYLGVVSVMLALHRPLSPYHTLTITDPEIPFARVIETTNLIASRYTNGYHLVYLPKYLQPTNATTQ